MTTPQFVPYEMKTTKIVVTSYQNRQIRGRLSNPYWKEDVPFENLMQLLLQLESLYDALNFPQQAMEQRSFGAEAAKFETAGAPAGAGKPLATFLVSVMFRQHASWQGRMVWKEREVEAQFRSALELMFLMDSALSRPV